VGDQIRVLGKKNEVHDSMSVIHRSSIRWNITKSDFFLSNISIYRAVTLVYSHIDNERETTLHLVLPFPVNYVVLVLDSFTLPQKEKEYY
jgi:hypothetical protein